MRIFINDISVRFIKSTRKLNLDNFNTIIDASKEKITKNKLIHHVLIQHIAPKDIEKLLAMFDLNIFRNLYSLTIRTHQFDEVRLHFRKQFSTIEAAGGLVRKGDKILMIYLIRKWDLPKGKLKKGETAAKSALREVEEECGIRISLRDKNMYHTPHYATLTM